MIKRGIFSIDYLFSKRTCNVRTFITCVRYMYVLRLRIDYETVRPLGGSHLISINKRQMSSEKAATLLQKDKIVFDC